MRDRLLIACAVALVGWSAPSSVSAGTIEGKIELPDEKQAPPVRSRGFVRRKANPIMPTKAYAPLAQMVVVLRGTIPPEAKQPVPTEPAKYKLVGESFESPLLVVRAGQTVRLVNVGRDSPHLYSKQVKSVAKDCAPLNPDVNCDFKLKNHLEFVEIRAQGNPHLRGRVLAIRHHLFSQVRDVGAGKKRHGTYKIENVPPGEWKVRIWYDGRWLGEAEKPVKVPKRRGRRDKPVKGPTYKLPNDFTKKPGK